MIRARDGHPPKYKNFPTKEEAKHWAKLEEARRLQETYFPDEAKKKRTLPELIDRYIMNTEQVCRFISTQSYPSGLVQLQYEVVK